MAAKLPLATILERIGHDGSEIIWPELSEPYCRRAFHIAECVAAVCDEWAVTELPLTARLSPDGQRILEIKMPKRLINYGVAVGVRLASGIRHAVAIDGPWILDPAEGVLAADFENQFKPECFYRFDLRN